MRVMGLDTTQITKVDTNPLENTNESYEPLKEKTWVEADAIARYRKDWAGLPREVRKHLQTRYPPLRDLPA